MKKALITACLAMLLAVLTGCGRSNSSTARADASQPRAVPVGVAPVLQRDVPILLEGLGTVTAYNTVTVRSRVDGEITQVNFREGQDVKQGALLVVVDPRPFEVALQQAQATLVRDQGQYNTAKLNYERDATLVKEGIVAQQQADQSRAQYEQFQGSIDFDKAQIRNAELNLKYTHITAPVNGRVGLRLVDVGNIVHANDTNGMLVITQMEPIAVIFTLPEDNINSVLNRMHQGPMSVDAFSRDDRDRIATGKLETVDNQIDPTTGTVRLKSVFDNKDRQLWPNQFVNAHLQLETRKNAIVVPASAVQRGQNGTFVYLVGSDNTAQVQNVQVNLTQGNLALIASGLQPGEQVVIDGQEKLQAGSKVAPQTRPAPAAGGTNGSAAGPLGAAPASTPPPTGAQGPPNSGQQQGNSGGRGAAGTRR